MKLLNVEAQEKEMNSFYKVLSFVESEIRKKISSTEEKSLSEQYVEKEVRELRVKGMFSFFCIEMYFYWSDPYNINDQFIHDRASERDTGLRCGEISQKLVY